MALWGKRSLCILGEQRHTDLGRPLARQSGSLESSQFNERPYLKIKRKKVEN